MDTCDIQNRKKYQKVAEVVTDKLALEAYVNNNSFDMDFDSFGSKSLLFIDLMNKFNDQSFAYQVKVKFLSNEFREKHKDFIEKAETYPNSNEIKAEVLLRFIDKNYGGWATKATTFANNSLKNTLLGLEKFEKKITKNANNLDLSERSRLIAYTKTKKRDLISLPGISNNNKEAIRAKYNQILEKLESGDNIRIVRDSIKDSIKNFYDQSSIILSSLDRAEDTKKFIDPFLRIMPDLEFLDDLVSNMDVKGDKQIKEKEDAYQKLKAIKERYLRLRDKVVIDSIRRMIEESNLDKSIIDQIVEKDSFGNDRLKTVQRDVNITENIFRWMRTNFTDLTLSNNPVIQLLGIAAINKNQYYVNNMNLDLDKLSEKLAALDAERGPGNEKYLDFYAEDKDGNKLNKLIQKTKFDKKDYHNAKSNGDKAIFREYSRGSDSKKLKTIDNLFQYWANNLDFNSEEFQEALKTEKIEWEYELSKLQRENAQSKKIESHIAKNPEIYLMHFQAWKDGNRSLTIDQFNSNHKSIIDSLSQKYELDSSLFQDSIFSNEYFGDFKFDKFIPIIGNDSWVTDEFKAFKEKYKNSPATLDFFEFFIDVAQKNLSLMPLENSERKKVNKYDLFESSKTIEEQMQEAGGLYNFMRIKGKENIINSISEASVLPGFREYNAYTGKYENRLSSPVQRGVSFKEASHDLGAVLAQHIVVSNTFAYKNEIEPFVSMTLNYLENMPVDENGVASNKKVDQELTQVESFSAQYLYGASLDPQSKGELYLDKDLKKEYDLMYEEYTQISNELDGIKYSDYTPSQKESAVKKKALEAQLVYIENQSRIMSPKEQALAMNNIAKLSIMGTKLSVSFIDAIQGVWGNLAEASTNAKFTIPQYWSSFWLTVGYFFGVNSKKIDKLMKLNHVDYKISELAMMGSSNAGLNNSNHPIAGIGQYFTNPKEAVATTSMTNAAFVFFRFSGLLNVLPVMIATLKNKNITLSDGSVKSIWDAADENGEFQDSTSDPYMRNGRLTVEGSRIGLEIGHTINMTHGNMSEKKPTVMNGHWYGKLLMTFKKWLPNNIEALVSSDRLDLIEGDVKAGQLTNTLRMLSNFSGDGYVSNLMKMAIVPILTFTGSRTKFDNISQVNSDQIVRLTTKTYVFLFLAGIFHFLVSGVDDDEEKVVWDEESNTYIKRRKSKKEYIAKADNYFFNIYHKSLRDLNPLNVITGLEQGTSVPLVSYMGRLSSLITDQVDVVNGHVEMTYDDLYQKGASKGENIKWNKFLDLTPFAAGIKKEYEYFEDPNKYKEQ